MSDNQLQSTLNFPENTEVGVRIRYIAKLNPKGVNQLAYQFGYPALKDHVDARVSFLNKFLKEEGSDDFDKAFFELIKIHPDRKLIADSQEEEYGNFEGHDNIFPLIPGIAKLGKKLFAGKGSTQSSVENTYIQQQMLAEQQKAARSSKNTLIAVSVAGGILIIIAVVVLVIYLKKNR